MSQVEIELRKELNNIITCSCENYQDVDSLNKEKYFKMIEDRLFSLFMREHIKFLETSIAEWQKKD